MQSLQGQDRKHARHQVEEDSAGYRAEQRPPQSVPSRPPQRRSVGRHRAGKGAKFQPAPGADRDDSGEIPRLNVFAREFGDEQIAAAAETLFRVIIDDPVGFRE